MGEGDELRLTGFRGECGLGDAVRGLRSRNHYDRYPTTIEMEI